MKRKEKVKIRNNAFDSEDLDTENIDDDVYIISYWFYNFVLGCICKIKNYYWLCLLAFRIYSNYSDFSSILVFEKQF